MPDTEMEEFYNARFLEFYNGKMGTAYEVIRRPEEDPASQERYDFECTDPKSTSAHLAVEVKTLRPSSDATRDSEELRKIIKEAQRILLTENQLPDDGKKYRAYVDFEHAPRKNEKGRYARKIAESIEKALLYCQDSVTGPRISCDANGCDCLKRLDLTRAHENTKEKVSFAFHAGEEIDIRATVRSALLKIFENTNSKLEVPKKKRKRTVLLIIHCLPWDVEWMIKAEIDSTPPGFQTHIDEIYLINRKSVHEYHTLRMK